MRTDKQDIVLGLLLHLGGVDVADRACQGRIIDSIRPVDKAETIWQAQDAMLGASWVIVLDGREVIRLAADRNDGAKWLAHTPTATASIVSPDGGYGLARVAAFHDTKHDVAPSALLRIGDAVVYRNISGNVVELPAALVDGILELNRVV